MIIAKLQLLKDTLESKFDIEKFKTFTREFFNEPQMLSARRHTGIWREYENSIKSYSDIAKFKDSEGNSIIVFAVELKNEKGVERARSLQRNFVSKILDQNNCEAAIVAFYSYEDVNWRLSFVRLDYTIKLKFDLTPAKRYSYLVGENETSHTAQKQLYPIFEDDNHNPTLDEIEAAFSVEKVTKDFFEQYKNKYYDLKEYLEKDEAFINETKKLGFEVNKFSEQFSKKLMGQLAFLYFLQKRGWLGVRIMAEDHCIEKFNFMNIYNDADNEHKAILKKFFNQSKEGKFKLSTRLFHSITDYEADMLSDCFVGTELDMPWGSGDKKFIRGIFDFCINNTNKNFFDDYLEPFFYDALNKRRKNQYYKQFNCKIPFLNGGLFEPLEGYHWRVSKFEIPNNIFSNAKEKGREADGILDIFDRYNFTINEDEPLEKEVAVDPEMLGKIFENLLDGKDRKAKGAFYTPREIVHYMCQESLINYLVNEVNVPYEDMKEFILYGEIIRDADNRSGIGNSSDFNDKKTIKQSIYDKIVEIDRALDNIRIADPAVGSGAFPLGMLNEIVRVKNNITGYLLKLDKSGKLDRRYGENYIMKIRSQYKMKWRTIKNCIFAVDIEPSAVDIAKLRLWLSVVVEQEIDEENPEPHPLPNLDCNIMVGNSLIDEYEGIKLFDETLLHKYRNKSKEESEAHSQIASTLQLSMLIDYSDHWIKEMFELQDRLFDEDEEHKKKQIKDRIDKIRDQLIEYKLNRDGNKKGINKYNEMKKLKMKPFFIWELEFAKVFKEKGGFDIVVGNPPYIGQSGNKDVFREVKATTFGEKYHQRRMDYHYFFYHKGIDLLKDGGHLMLITTNYFLDAINADKLREDIRKRSKIKKIINFNELKIFENAIGQHNLIMLLEKRAEGTAKVYTSMVNRKGLASSQILLDIFSGVDKFTEYNIFDDEELFDARNGTIHIKNIFSDVETILEKMSKEKTTLGELTNINQGIVTGCNKISKKHLKTFNGDWHLNQGIFVLSDDEVESLNLNNDERKLIKPWFKNSDIHKWCTEESTKENLIYYATKHQYSNIRNVQRYLEKFKIILINRNVRTGNVTEEQYQQFVAGTCNIPYVMIASEMKKGNYYCVSYAREERIFEEPKIVVPQRSKTNTFGYNEITWFGATDVYFITQHYEKISLKYLLGLLNSKVYYFWLYHRGKRKGETLELFLKPLSEIPIPISTEEIRGKIEVISDKIIEIKRANGENLDIKKYEDAIDNIIYKLFDLSENEIKIIDETYQG